MQNKKIKNLGILLAIAGAFVGVAAADTDTARTEARSRKDVKDPQPRECFKEDCASEKTTNAMAMWSMAAMLTGGGLILYAKKRESK